MRVVLCMLVTQIYRYMYNYATSEPALCFCNFLLQESRLCEPIMERNSKASAVIILDVSSLIRNLPHI